MLSKMASNAARVAARSLATTSVASQKAGAAEVATLLEGRIMGAGSSGDLQETGQVLAIGDGIARVHGLRNIQAEEMVEFSSGVKGMVSITRPILFIKTRILSIYSQHFNWETAFLNFYW